MAVIKASSHSGDVRLECEAVVVGTGAGGGMMVRELAAAGVDVIALEMGGDHGPRDFNQREDEMFELLFQQRGALATEDLRIRILAGLGIGGSTVHNTNLCKRTPEALLEAWAREHAVEGCGPDELRPAFEATEAELAVSRMGPSELNANNRIFKAGVEALGWRGGFLSHNRTGCTRSGFCELGCAYDAKNNSAKVLIPRALEDGARVYEGMRVERVLVERGRLVGVAGSVLDVGSLEPVHGFELRARAVCLAASALRSPIILARSGIGSGSRRTGRGFRCHPGAIAAGVFKEPVEGWRGIPQSYECTELLSLGGGRGRVWMVPGFAHPIGTAAMAPGFGPQHMAFMRCYPHLAAIIVMLDEEGEGRVRWHEGRLRVAHELTAADRAELARGLEAAGQLLFAAGAEEVVIPYHEPLRARSVEDLAAARTRGVPDYDLPLTGVHPMGTLAMGEDRRRAVVDSRGQHHDLPGLFVCDASIFPTALGVPPQLSIYSFARHFAPGVLGFLRG